MAKVVKFFQVHGKGAGIDIGTRQIFVSVDGTSAVNFQTYTADYEVCCKYLLENGITEVAMEATGVYWFCLYTMLEDHGIRVCLVNPREVQQVRGRKSDVQDCQWIQQLFTAGLLRESLIPQGLLKELRFLVRERLDLIESSSTYVNKMQRALELMNIKLANVISQIQGASGLKILRAILAGERDPERLASLCHKSILKTKAWPSPCTGTITRSTCPCCGMPWKCGSSICSKSRIWNRKSPFCWTASTGTPLRWK